MELAKEKRYLAIDIGASSGRAILSKETDGLLETEEVYRFPNSPVEQDGHLDWDIDRLLEEVENGIKAAFRVCPDIESLAIDTWGCDYVLLKGNEVVYPCYCYRDFRTEKVIDEVHSLIPFSELYSLTGIQFQPFNTLYQLYADKIAGRLEGVSDFLMLPEYLSYRLTGVKRKEYTNATTTGLVGIDGQFFKTIINRLGLPSYLFPKLSQPGTIVGTLLPEVVAELGGNCVVKLCASHDTASAVEGVVLPSDALYLSSGTWSLLGAKVENPITTEAACACNFSNEGGPGYIRFQKNIMGMWVINRLKDEICPKEDFAYVIELAKQSRSKKTVAINGPAYLAPVSMRQAIEAEIGEGELSPSELFRIAFNSLAKSYADTIKQIEDITHKSFDSLVIFGGGAKNGFLNELTEKISGKRVIALPVEATSLGNLKIQMKGDKA